MQNKIKSLSNADALVRMAANAMHGAEEYAEMGPQLVGGQGGETLHQAGKYMSNRGVAYTILGNAS